MKTPAKVGAYLVGLAVAFVAALGVGSAVGPVGPAGAQTPPSAQTDVDHGGADTDHGTGN